MFWHRSFSRPWLALLFAGALLFAQWLLVQHGASVEQHAAPHACEWCLSHAPLQAGVPAAALPLLAAGSLSFFPIVVLVIPASAPLLAYVTRAPPLDLSV